MDSEAEASGETDRPAPPNRHSRAVAYGPAPETPCALCASWLRGADDLVIHYHRERDDDSTPAPATACRGVCPDCAEEVAELVGAWSATTRPPIRAGRSIAAGYRAVADECSFCDRPADGDSLVGVEYYRAGTAYGDGLGPHRHYALCLDCVGVFERFLDDVAADVTDEGPERAG